MAILDNLHGYSIILASQSPRRRELLAGLDIAFEVRTLPDLDESYPPTLPAHEVATYIAQKKAHAYASWRSPKHIIITADTVVCLGDIVLGKPTDSTDAKRMLRQMAGRTHQVVTAVSLMMPHGETTFDVTSTVRFGALTDEEINYYVDRYAPMDKAGSYGIQEWIGMAAIESIEGSFYNVMGLPVQRLYQVLKAIPSIND